MTEAKIELVSKPITGTGWLGDIAPQHLYILVTQSNGEQNVIRGGPENNNWLKDDLKVTNSIYDKDHSDFENRDKGDIHHKRTLASGSDSYINSIVSSAKFNNIFNSINSASLDYKMAGFTLGSWQNSNAVAKHCVEAMGLQFELPTYRNSWGRDVKVIAPGVNDNLSHTDYALGVII